MTMRELAKLAGVSVSTVSKAFSGSREISVGQRENIFRIAKENGCYEKYNGLHFEKKVIAVIGPEFQSPYYAQQLSILEKEICKRGAIMVTGCYNFEEDAVQDLVSYFSGYAKVDGILTYHKQCVLGESCEVPVVLIGGESEVHDSITLSWQGAMEDAIEHLVENGHRHIAFVGEFHTKIKYAAFEKAMQKNRLDVPSQYVKVSSFRFEKAGYVEMNKLLELEQPPTAVLTAYDSIAIGAMKSVYEHGLKIPEDISLIGMDDIRLNPFFETPLTSVTSYNADLCEIAVDMLFDRMRSKDAERKSIKVSATLVKRGSVGKI